MPKTAFVSYAHEDRGFVERLADNLNVYADVFWDKDLSAGDWREQLQSQIEARSFFLVVMSPEQASSGMCQWELEIAKATKDRSEIIPIRLYMNHRDADLEKLQYAEFTRGFDEGFRLLTFLMLGERFSPWESFSDEADHHILLDQLRHGRIPSHISTELGDWLIIEPLWYYLTDEIIGRDKIMPRVLPPSTPKGILGALQPIFKYSIRSGDIRLAQYATEINKIAQGYLEDHSYEPQDINAATGTKVADLIQRTQKFLVTSTRSISDTQTYTGPFYPYVMDKLRHLIIDHARRHK